MKRQTFEKETDAFGSELISCIDGLDGGPRGSDQSLGNSIQQGAFLPVIACKKER